MCVRGQSFWKFWAERERGREGERGKVSYVITAAMLLKSKEQGGVAKLVSWLNDFSLPLIDFN